MARGEGRTVLARLCPCQILASQLPGVRTLADIGGSLN